MCRGQRTRCGTKLDHIVRALNRARKTLLHEALPLAGKVLRHDKGLAWTISRRGTATRFVRSSSAFAPWLLHKITRQGAWLRLVESKCPKTLW